MLIMWIAMVFLGFRYNKVFLVIASGLLGIFLSFILMVDVYVWAGVIMMFTNIYLIFHGLFKMMETGGKK